ncbi:MAG: hypothetical protein GEU93_07100 [Propionibacteriales bacterium]|nr:hypothetical protein [Propionibacteriales bacterium]
MTRSLSASPRRSARATLGAVLITLVAVLIATTPSAAAPGTDDNAAPIASGFQLFKFPQGQPLCTGVGLNVSANPFFARDDCGFSVFSVSDEPGELDVAFFGPGADQPFATAPVTQRDGGEYEFSLTPASDWPAGDIRAVVRSDGSPAGETTFGHNRLGATLTPARTSGGYRPGDDIPVTGTVSQLDTTANTTSETGVPATVALRLVTPDGTAHPVTDEAGAPRRFTAADDGSFEATVPGELTADVRADATTDYQASVAIEVVDAAYTDPSTGEWAALEAGSGSATIVTPPDGLVLENSFVSAVGWVRPGESYPFRIFVKNFSDQAFDAVRVTIPAPDGASFTRAVPARGAGTVRVRPRGVTWELGEVIGRPQAGPTVRTLLVEAQADGVGKDPQVVWKNLSSTATLTYSGPGERLTATSHGPKVIPPAEAYDTARYGDRPFPVVPVDFLDRPHQDDNSGDELARVINSPDVEGSTFNLYQEISLGQLFPHGDVPSAGVVTRGFEYGPGFEFTQPEPQGTCRGVSASDLAGSPAYPERIRDGFYQLPGTTDYYGDDRTGSALAGALTGIGLLFDIDSACGPTGKMVYDAAQVADPEIDYSDYDTDKDGVVDFFMVVYAGCGGHGASQLGPLGCPYDTVPYDNVWPHSSSLEAYYTDPETGLKGYISDDQLKDHEGRELFYTKASRVQVTTESTDFPVFVRVGPYNVNPETAMEAASVISHEYGHSLGLPDFYSLGSRETYGDWNLMATDKSQHMDIFSRQELGWVVPEVLEPGQREVTGWTDSKEDTHQITWQTPDGTPYTLSGPDVHNAQAYVAKLPARQLIDPDKFASGDGASLAHAWWSGSGNDFGCPPQGGHNLDLAVPGLADLPEGSTVTLTFASHWDIEWDFDYGFVLTSTDGGETYQSHPSERGFTTPATQNPNANSCQGGFGNGITGTSGSYQAGTQETDRLLGEYPEPVFLTDEYDVSELAGAENGVLRFAYSTDAGLARPAWFIDDITVTATTPDGDQVLLETDLEDDGGPDDPRFYNGGCKDTTRVAAVCTPGWNYISAVSGSAADHAYYMELRDRSGFDLDGRGQNDRDPIGFAPGLSLVYTDETHGYGNVGTDNPPAQTPLDSQPEPLSDTPNLNDAAWTADTGDSGFSDSGDGHTDNYTDAAGEPWLFRFGCLSFDVLTMSGAENGPVQADGDLTADVGFNVSDGCAAFDYGYGN